MKILNRFTLKRAFCTVGALGLLAIVSGAGCSATDGTGTPTSCNDLDISSRAQATVQAYGQAAGALSTAAAKVEAKWLATCNAINADLDEDKSQTSAAKACAVLNARVKKALNAGVTVDLQVQADYHADVILQAEFEGKFHVDAP